MQRRIVRSIYAVVVTVLLTAGVSAVAQASPGSGSGVLNPAAGDGSKPLPGYTISNPPLAPLTAGGVPTKVVQGVFEHAAFDVEYPANWNGQLVMWAHGYRGTGTVLTVDAPDYGLRQTFVDEGYAWAASSYYDNGYDVRSGVLSEHDLAVYAGTLLHRTPSRTYIVGVSMGGQVIGRSLEQYPYFYSGALPMCGVLGDDRLFDFFVDYNLVAQALAEHPAYPPTSTYLTADVPAIEAKLGLVGLTPGQNPTNALGRQLQAITVQRSGGTRPGAAASFSIWKDFLFALAMPDNGGSLAMNAGRLAQNQLTRYSPDSPVDVDKTVQRINPVDLQSRLSTKLIEIPRILGKPRVPVLTLHGLGDMFVPFSMEEFYARNVAKQGESDLLVQRAVREAGHCEYTPTEVGHAWTALQKWVRARAAARKAGVDPNGATRPRGDDVINSRVVAGANYGCRFTDQSAYNDPADFPTRGLFAKCPAT